MNDNKQWECELPPEARATLDRIRDVQVPRESVERVVAAAVALGQEDKEPPVVSANEIQSRASVRSSTRAVAWIAAMVVVALSATIVLISQRSAWAQVISAVADRPWMRLTLQKPTFELPPGETVPNVVMWFSGDRRIAALDMPGKLHWLNVPKKDEWVYDLKSETIRRGVIDSADGEHVGLMMAMLHQLKAPMPDQRGGVTVTKQERAEVRHDNQTWDLFRFELEVSAGQGQRFEIRVDQQTHRPMELKRWFISDGKLGEYPATFAIDYPDAGPDDVYALGAPKDARVFDVRNLDKYFPERKSRETADYEAIVVHFYGSKPLAWVFEAQRFRHNAGGTTGERADIEKVFELSQSVYSGSYGPSKTPPAKWWAEEADRLPMEHYEVTSSNAPHDQCYMPYGGPSNYESLHESDGTLPGLEDTIELRGPKLSVWLDPARDLIVRRYEMVAEDGSIDVWQYDEVRQGPNGTWFPKVTRRGHVDKRGAALDNEQETDGVSVTIAIAEIDFL